MKNEAYNIHTHLHMMSLTHDTLVYRLYLYNGRVPGYHVLYTYVHTCMYSVHRCAVVGVDVTVVTARVIPKSSRNIYPERVFCTALIISLYPVPTRIMYRLYLYVPVCGCIVHVCAVVLLI